MVVKQADDIPAHVKLINELLILNLIETLGSFLKEMYVYTKFSKLFQGVHKPHPKA